MDYKAERASEKKPNGQRMVFLDWDGTIQKCVSYYCKIDGIELIEGAVGDIEKQCVHILSEGGEI